MYTSCFLVNAQPGASACDKCKVTEGSLLFNERVGHELPFSMGWSIHAVTPEQLACSKVMPLLALC